MSRQIRLEREDHWMQILITTYLGINGINERTKNNDNDIVLLGEHFNLISDQ